MYRVGLAALGGTGGTDKTTTKRQANKLKVGCLIDRIVLLTPKSLLPIGNFPTSLCEDGITDNALHLQFEPVM